MSDSGKVKINMFKFTWALKNFSKKCINVEEKVTSPIFSLNSFNESHQWRLVLYPFGMNDSVQGFLSLFLQNETSQEIKIAFDLMLLDNNGTEVNKVSLVHKFEGNKSWGLREFLKRDILLQQKNSLLVGDTLNISCTIHMNIYSKEEVNIHEVVLYNYELLLLHENWSDLTIAIGEKQIKVHKNILSARSRVFAAMFKHDMVENNTDIIKITDVSYDIMREILLFIYSGKINNLKNNAKELLAAAEKYEIKELKALCQRSLWENIKIKNACEILSIADLYNCNELKVDIIDYIVTNIKKIDKTPTFRGLNRSNPELFEDIVSTIIKKNF